MREPRSGRWRRSIARQQQQKGKVCRGSWIVKEEFSGVSVRQGGDRTLEAEQRHIVPVVVK